MFAVLDVEGKTPSLKIVNILYMVSIMPQYQAYAHGYLMFSSCSCFFKDPDSTCYLTPKVVSFI